MEDEAQKMMALKKAYAEIILNTAKEAAAKVMASERRALRFQQELSSAKDEALRMLVRLKQMIDSKTAEAEMTSLKQQQKIEELEAQLNEAEDVITDLRAELKQVWVELEKTKNTQVQSFNAQIIKQAACFEESARPVVIVPSPSNQELESGTAYEVENKHLNRNGLDDKSCNATKQTEQFCISNLGSYAQDSEFASIIMRSKEPDLCKNGCTQRIRASEGNLLDEKLLTQDVHNQHFGVKSGFVIKDSNGDIEKSSEPSSGTKKVEIMKHLKCKRKQKKIFSYCRSCFVSFCKSHNDENCKSDKGSCSLPFVKHCNINKSNRKKGRRRHVIMESSVCEPCKPSFVLKQCSSVCNNSKCSEDECDIKMKPVPCLTDVELVHGSSSVSPSVRVINNFGFVQKAVEKDNESHVSMNLEESTSKNSPGPSCDMKVDVPSTNTDLEDAKASENNVSPDQADDSRLLRYTFRRKRRKESLGNPEEKTTPEQSTVKRRAEVKQNGASEPQKSSLIEESSRDSRRLAQVAHQLISLSAKRW